MISGAIFALLVSSTVLFSLTAVTGEVNNTYFITAPSVFRPGQLFTLQVTLSSIVTTPVNITCGIVDTTKQNVLIASERGFFSAGTVQKLTLKIPHGVASDSGYYVLAVNGTGGATFSERKYIRFVEKGFTIYIQTDKAVYKPGQNVLMRIFAVHPDLKVYRGSMTVDILDPNGNKMAHWVNLDSASGVIKREFLLSTQPVEGNWKISVSAAEDQKAEQVIEVKPYVLPKFEVKVELPPYLLEKEKALRGKVTVRYTYGKGAKGRANIQLYFNTYSRGKRPALAKDIAVDGEGSFTFDKGLIQQLFKESFSWNRDTTILYRYQYFVSVNATFHEDLTGKVASGQGSVSLHEMDVKLKFPDFNPGYFKPGLPFEVMLQVVKPNGDQHSPDTLKSMKVNIKTSYNWGKKSSEESLTPSEDGSIIIKRQIPSDAGNVELEAKYSEGQKTESASFWAYKADSPSKSYIQLSTTTPSVKAGDNISLDVRASFSFSELRYMVMARGVSVATGAHVSPSSKRSSLFIQSTAAMAPTARVLVYCMTQNGEIVVDSLNVKIDDPFQNQVSMTIDTGNRKTVSPGDMVTVKGKATPGSFMAFRAVDKSVLLMKEDTDLSVKKVLEDLQSYDSARTVYPYWEWGFGRRRRSIMPFPTSGSNAGAIFENSGVIVITNYQLPKREMILYKTVMFGKDLNNGSRKEENVLFL